VNLFTKCLLLGTSWLKSNLNFSPFSLTHLSGSPNPNPISFSLSAGGLCLLCACLEVEGDGEGERRG